MLLEKASKKEVLKKLREQNIYVYDNSMLNNFRRCQFYYYNRHELGLIRKSEETYKLEFGRAIHKALEFWYSSSDPNKNEKSIQIFQSNFAPFEEQPTDRNKNPIYTLIFGSSLLTAYFDKYHTLNEKISYVELPLMEELAPGVFFAGKIDLVIENNDYIIITDHKTSQYVNNFTINPNPQLMGYTFLIQAFTGRTLDKIKVSLDILGISKRFDPGKHLIKLQGSYSTFTLNEWKKSTIDIINQINSCRKNSFWRKDWNCRAYFKDCSYMPLCTANNEQLVEDLRNTLYEVKSWDPFMED